MAFDSRVINNPMQKMLFDIYRSAGINTVISALIVCQNAFETKVSGGAVFSTPNFRNNNNIGGITWKDSFTEGGTVHGVVVRKGTPRGTNESGYYVKFASVEDCAKFIAAMYKGKYSAALDAGNLTTFVHIIKGIGYFESNEADYIAAMNGVKNNYLDPNLRQIIDNPRTYNEELDAVAVNATIKKNCRN